MKKYIILNLICLMVSQASAMGVGYASIVYEIVDTENHPVEGAHVTIYWSDTKGGVAKGVSDRSGRVTLSSNRGSLLTVAVEKEGYYRTRGEIWEGNLRTAPPKSFTVTLKRIINPVPMVHRRISTEIPRLNEPVGFDLEEGDWVSPHGKGKRADVVLTATKRLDGTFDWEATLVIRFPDPHNGIQEFYASRYETRKQISQFIAPHEAPDQGYNSELIYRVYRLNDNNEDYRKEDRNYIFRTRSVVDENKFIKSNYGWIRGEIDFRVIYRSETLPLEFEYYYNPNPESRSLEPLDMKR